MSKADVRGVAPLCSPTRRLRWNSLPTLCRPRRRNRPPPPPSRCPNSRLMVYWVEWEMVCYGRHGVICSCVCVCLVCIWMCVCVSTFGTLDSQLREYCQLRTLATFSLYNVVWKALIDIQCSALFIKPLVFHSKILGKTSLLGLKTMASCLSMVPCGITEKIWVRYRKGTLSQRAAIAKISTCRTVCAN